MSDAPKSWNDPNDVILGRDSAPILTRDGATIPVKRPAAEPLPEPGGRYEFHNHVHHHHTDPRVDAVLAAVQQLASAAGSDLLEMRNLINSLGAKAMVAFADLMQEVTRQTTVVDGVVTYVQGTKEQLAALQASFDAVRDQLDNGTDAELQAAIDAMKANNDRAVAAITANTPEPTPEPAPETPAEPAPEQPVGEPGLNAPPAAPTG